MKSPTAKKTTTPATSLEATVRAFEPELNGFLQRHLRGRGVSPEDVRQDTYLRMLRFTDGELVREPRAYLFRVARNVAHDKMVLAERERATFDSSGDSIASSEGIAPDETAQIDSARDVEQILSRLPPVYRSVLQLRTASRLSYKEIATELKLTENTVKKYMHLALVQCRLISLELK